MNLTDRIYIGVHVALAVLVCARYQRVEHWPWYVVCNFIAIVLIFTVARKQSDDKVWEFAHDWLPVIFFITVFEEVSYLSLSVRGEWQNAHLVAVESLIFAVPPALWMHEHLSSWVVEFLEFGYFAFYPLYPVFGGMFWTWRRRPGFADVFRRLTDALSTGYVVCYATYLLFPTKSPANLFGVQQFASAHGGPFHALVGLIQSRGGVHGNAFPSAHIMLAFVVLVFVWRFLPRVAPWVLVSVVLMCLGAVYDGYHYASDVVAGAAIGIALGWAFIRSMVHQNKTLP
ncbi:MAG: phosphatase PAP2 family protein [Candidatus Korobacteraceae bacterium]|jgi:membrane-associated phospholipid phosphatase